MENHLSHNQEESTSFIQGAEQAALGAMLATGFVISTITTIPEVFSCWLSWEYT